MKRLLTFIITIFLITPAGGSAEMTGKCQMERTDRMNHYLYAAIDRETDIIYFWVPEIWGLSSIYQYHPEFGFRRLSILWNSAVKTMIVSNGMVYYTLYNQLDATGISANLYSLNPRTGLTYRLLKNEDVRDIYAAGDGKLLVHIMGGENDGHPAGFYFYDLKHEKLTRQWEGFQGVEFGEKGVSLRRTTDDSWVYYDYSLGSVAFDTDFHGGTDSSVCIFSPNYWIEKPYSLSVEGIVYLNGDRIYTVEKGVGVTSNERYVVWWLKTDEEQQIHVLDVYASKQVPQIKTYEVVTSSNIFILDRYAVMKRDDNTCNITMIDLDSGEISLISPAK